MQLYNDFLFQTKNFTKFIFILSLFYFIFSLNAFTANAQLLTPAIANADQASERAALEKELADLEMESKKIQADLDNKKGERASLERDLSIVNSKISASKNQISKLSLTIKKLNGEITAKETKLDTLGDRIDNNKVYISKALQELRKIDDIRAIVAIAGNNSLSEVFMDRGEYKSLQESLADNVNRLQLNKKFVEVEKEVLEDKKDENEALKAKQEKEKKKSESISAEKKTLVNIAKGEEKKYQELLAEKQKRATQIKNRLFALRDTGDITFDKAQQFALAAQKLTGVRAALILGILKQESNIGQNVGRCFLTNATTGEGKNVNGSPVKKVMKPGRDIEPFISLMKELDKDPYNTRVSCPVPGIGWGGAMGPTQFIPSTWMSYKNRVQALTNGNGDPWNAYEAIFATALYLADRGAKSNNYTDERNAACKYYSGKSCSSGPGSSYGNSVMKYAGEFQDDIDLLSEVK